MLWICWIICWCLIRCRGTRLRRRYNIRIWRIFMILLRNWNMMELSKYPWTITPNSQSKTTGKPYTNKSPTASTPESKTTWTCQSSPPKTATTRKKKTQYQPSPSTNNATAKKETIPNTPAYNKSANNKWKDSNPRRREKPARRTSCRRKMWGLVRVRRRIIGLSLRRSLGLLRTGEELLWIRRFGIWINRILVVVTTRRSDGIIFIFLPYYHIIILWARTIENPQKPPTNN